MKKEHVKNYGKVKEKFPIVTISSGKVMGENRGNIGVFRGIPYGEKCDGKQRFLPAEAVKKWKGVRDCRKNGFIAPQFGGSISGSREFGSFFSGKHPENFQCEQEIQNENCLVLNVLTPGLDDRKRPVVVYIHGGGYATGSGTLVLGADQWVKEEDIVLVGVNHRLNIFGYLYLGEFGEKYRDSGAVGILDIILALKWVKQNIQVFGGDCNNVTVMGESGGGAKINTLLLMKEAAGLFHKAIIESGSIPAGMRKKEEGIHQTRKILKYIGVDAGNLELLEYISVNKLLEAMKKTGNDSALAFAPIVEDTDILAENIYTVSEWAKDIPILIGSSEDEMAAFIDVSEIQNITWENIEHYLENAEKYLLESVYDLKKFDKNILIDSFREWNKKEDAPGHVFIKIVSLLSVLGAGAYYQAKEKCEKNGSVFYYVFAKDITHPTYESEKYSWHTADLPLQMRIVRDSDCEEISKYMSKAWAAFIRSGNPSIEGRKWSPFTINEPWAMLIDDNVDIIKDPLEKERNLLETLLGLKWKNYRK